MIMKKIKELIEIDLLLSRCPTPHYRSALRVFPTSCISDGKECGTTLLMFHQTLTSNLVTLDYS